MPNNIKFVAAIQMLMMNDSITVKELKELTRIYKSTITQLTIADTVFINSMAEKYAVDTNMTEPYVGS